MCEGLWGRCLNSWFRFNCCFFLNLNEFELRKKKFQQEL